MFLKQLFAPVTSTLPGRPHQCLYSRFTRSTPPSPSWAHPVVILSRQLPEGSGSKQSAPETLLLRFHLCSLCFPESSSSIPHLSKNPTFRSVSRKLIKRQHYTCPLWHFPGLYLCACISDYCLSSSLGPKLFRERILCILSSIVYSVPHWVHPINNGLVCTQ